MYFENYEIRKERATMEHKMKKSVNTAKKHKKYDEPEIKIIAFAEEDVITTSFGKYDPIILPDIPFRK